MSAAAVSPLDPAHVNELLQVTDALRAERDALREQLAAEQEAGNGTKARARAFSHPRTFACTCVRRSWSANWRPSESSSGASRGTMCIDTRASMCDDACIVRSVHASVHTSVRMTT